MAIYRNRNIDIFIAGGTALLGGAAYVAKVPGPVQVASGVALFFAPGYLWSQAILSHRLPGLERVLTSAGLALILPIVGGFLFYGLRIPLFRSAWVGMLVVLTLLGVVAVAVQRLREQPEDPRRDPRRDGQRPRGGPSAMNLSVYGLAVVVGIGAIAFSVKNADAQKFPGFTSLGMSPVITISAPQALLVNPQATLGGPGEPPFPGQGATQAHLTVINHEGKTEQYEIKLMKRVFNNKTGREGPLKLVSTFGPFTLADGATWQKTIAYTSAAGKPTMLANLYLLPDLKNRYRWAENTGTAPTAKPSKKPKAKPTGKA